LARTIRRGKWITNAIAILIAAGPSLFMLRLVGGHWQFPRVLWILQLGPAFAISALLYRRFNPVRIGAGLLLLGAVTINLVHQLVVRQQGSALGLFWAHGLTILIGWALLWSRTVRAYFRDATNNHGAA
jgi:hypothetical protein